MKNKLPTVGKGSVSFIQVNLAPDSLKLAKNFVLGRCQTIMGSKLQLFIIRGIRNYPNGEQ
jgi:hypothetical protein